jgi:hypothetical protein
MFLLVAHSENFLRMKLTPWYFVAFAPVAVAGCSGAFMGQCAVLAVTLCIFFGTLSLGSQSQHSGGVVGGDSARAPRV